MLKNKNVRPILIPYLAGVLDITTLKLKSSEEKDLLITIKEHRSGGILFIPMGWSNAERIERYKRMD